MNPRLQRLRDAGVSVWLDTLSRELLETGELARLVERFGVTGATSNPTIFASALRTADKELLDYVATVSVPSSSEKATSRE